ncbi:MAG: radical SAM protein [Muribaculaceae bacterium]|nr:radical SAM protein [Muribaculaceae bacterium]
MNIYKYLKLAVSGRIPDRLKLLGLWAFLIGKRRMVGIFFDPVLACNLRCKMCYMSDAKGRQPMKGQRVSGADLDRLAKAFYRRALKLQIGCSTEPTLFPDLPLIISHAKHHEVPYISITTNGKLIAQGRVDLKALAEAGLDEMTLSLHGTSKEIYEELMPGAKFEELKTLTAMIAEVKRCYPDFKLRINYTINSRNIYDLESEKFWGLWAEGGLPDIIQLRPVQNMGETSWNDFDLTPLKEHYDNTIGAIRTRSSELGITCIAPEPDQIDEVATDQDFTSALIKEITYCYVSPDSLYTDDFQTEDNFDSYHRRKKTAMRLLRAVFSRDHKSAKRDSSKHLNYRVN